MSTSVEIDYGNDTRDTVAYGVMSGLPQLVVEEPAKYDVASYLRVEELKISDEKLGGQSSSSACSSVYGTDDEGLTIASDQDLGRESDTQLGEIEMPGDDVRDHIISLVEYYFSDENLVKDPFMLKHVRRNKEGYVSLKLVTSFRNIKRHSKDYRVVARCLEHSKMLGVNSEGTKVRRLNPLPDIDETSTSKVVMVKNLSSEITLECITEMFSKCGVISVVRMVREGTKVPTQFHKYVVQHGNLAQFVCAFIEFEECISAQKACKVTNEALDWWKSVEVFQLVNKPEPKKTKNQKTDTEKPQKNCSKGRSGEGFDSDKFDDRRKKSSASGDNGDQNNGGGKVIRNSLSPQNQNDNAWLTPSQSPWSTPGSTPRSSPKSSPRTSPNSTRRRNRYGPGPSPLSVDLTSSGGESPAHSPWVQRRMRAIQDGTSPGTSPLVGRKSYECGASDGGPMGYIRQPRGPDGSKGFSLQRRAILGSGARLSSGLLKS